MEHDPKKYYTLKQFLSQIGMSYTAYRVNRAKGVMPPEVRVSKRKILIRVEAAEQWAKRMETQHESSESSTQPA